jgi:nicotinate dehydrogenase subunit A
VTRRGRVMSAGDDERRTAAGSSDEEPVQASPRPDTAAPGRRRSRAAIAAGGVAAAAAVVGGGAYLAERAGLVGGGLRVRVNGSDHAVAAAPDTPLLYVLRNEMGLTGPHFGCGFAECGACTVQVDGKAVRSCVTKVADVRGREVTTLEGLGTPARPHPLQQAFIDQQAAQCGYCISGMIMESAALLAARPKPTDADIKTALSGHLCRCGTHYRILRAVRVAAAAGVR